jgi:orotate phosphoribosyltransferase
MLPFLLSNSHSVDGSQKPMFDVIFGPAYKGIPLAAVVGSALFSDFGVDVAFSYNRKEKKDHGEGGQLVGASLEGKSVLIIDDVITAGTAIRESFDIIEAAQAKPMGVVIALDRAEIRSEDDRISAVQAVQRDFGIPVVSIINLPQLQGFLKQSKEFSSETLSSVAAYRERYGV